MITILAIDTSADETAAAITQQRRIISNVIYSQIAIHRQWGGIYPTLAKRAHEEKIDGVVDLCLRKFRRISDVKIDAIAVTQGPGLAIALEVGIKKAKELSAKFDIPLIAVNHLEGHLYSCFAQNRSGRPSRVIKFPYLGLIISGGHTEFVMIKNHLEYEVIGQTIDDAAGEALDKAAKLLGFGYPGGPVIERLAEEVGNIDKYHFPRPMLKSANLNFSFSGLKTAFYYYSRKMTEKEKAEKIRLLASAFQEAVFDVVLKKTQNAIKTTGIRNLVIGGGVIANLYLRRRLRSLAKKYQGQVLFPPFKYLTGDNAAMIGIVAGFKAENKLFVNNIDSLDRVARLAL